AAVSPPSAQTTISRTASRMNPPSDHHIDDPTRHHNHLFGCLPPERALDLVEGQHGCLNILVPGIARNRDLSPFLAVDLDRQGDGVPDQQVGLYLRPSLRRHEGFVP